MEQVEDRLKALMLQSLAGDERAYRVLLKETGERLRAYYARRLAEPSATEDLVQETLIAVHARRGTFDIERPFTAWLHAIARYKLIDYLRAHRKHRHVPIDDAPDDFLSVDETASVGVHQDLNQVLETVPTVARGLIRAVKIEGRSIAEVSASSGLSESAVKVSIHRALKRLSQRFGGDSRHG